jgi:hypothetical protein
MTEKEPFPWLELLEELRGVIRGFLSPPDCVQLQRTCKREGLKENTGCLLAAEFVSTRFNKEHLLLRQWYWHIVREFWRNDLFLKPWPDACDQEFIKGFRRRTTTDDLSWSLHEGDYHDFWSMEWRWTPLGGDGKKEFLQFGLTMVTRMKPGMRKHGDVPVLLETRIKHQEVAWNLMISTPYRVAGCGIYHHSLGHLIKHAPVSLQWISPHFHEGFNLVFPQ